MNPWRHVQVPAARSPSDFKDDDTLVAGLLEARQDACQSVDTTRITVLQCSCTYGIGTFRDEHFDVASLIMLVRARVQQAALTAQDVSFSVDSVFIFTSRDHLSHNRGAWQPV